MDPFTQKILERAKARKEYLDAQFAKLPQPAPRKRRSPLKEENASTEKTEISEKNQSNDDDSVGKRQCLARQNSSEIKRDLKENVTVPKITPLRSRGLKALARLHSNQDEFADQKDEEDLPVMQSSFNCTLNKLNSEVETPIPKERSNRLAALASNINNWEDDLTRKHSTAKSRTLLASKSSPQHSSSGFSQISPTSNKTSPKPSPSKRDTIPASTISPICSTPKLRLEATKSPAKVGSPGRKVGRSSSTASSASSAASSKRRSSSYSLSSPPTNKRPSQKNSPSGVSQQNSKRVVWDQAIVATLQAQGFVQSPSKSKLEYNFQKIQKNINKDSVKEVERASESDTEDDDYDNSGVANAPVPDVFQTTPSTVSGPPKKSVKELAQKFASPAVMPMNDSQKDPAELPLSARVALFEKEATNASNSKTNTSAKRLISRMPSNKTRASCSAPAVVSCPGSQLASPVKKMAKMSPAKKDSEQLSVSPAKVGKHTFQLHRKLFEHVNDDWKENEISAKIREERQKDMEVVLNRWSHKGKEAAVAATSSVHREGWSSVQVASQTPVSAGKPVPSKPKEQVPKSIPPPPPLPDNANIVVHARPSGHLEAGEVVDNSSSDEEMDKALNEESSSSYEADVTDPLMSDSSEPNEEDTQRAIRTLDEAIPDDRLEDSTDADNYDSDELEDHPNETGLDSSILKAAFTKVSPLKNPDLKRSYVPETYVTPAPVVQTPVAVRNTNANNTPKDLERDVETPLMHTVSFYRRQKDTVRLTPVRTVVRQQAPRSPQSPPQIMDSAEFSPRSGERICTIQDKIKDLTEEVNRQQVIISQASQAITVCRSTSEFHGSAEQIEGEKLLLIASQRLTACLNEIKRLKTEGAFGAEVFSCKGSLSISDIRLPLKKAFLQETDNGKTGDFVSFFLVLVKFRSLVISTQMVSTHDCISNGSFMLPNLINIRELNRDFNVVVEVYGLQTKRENIVKQQKTLPSKKEKSRLALTPKKRQSKRDLRMGSPAVLSNSSSASICTSSFHIIGFATINITTLQRKSWVLEKCPHTSPLEGNILMKVQCHTDVATSEEQGFLTMFEDVGGFGAWHRRWFNLSTRYLSYWKYPDDVKRKDPMGCIDLCKCVTPNVGLVSRDICARPHTFMLLTVRPPSQNDENTLVSQSYSSYTVNKVLLSADTKEERISWCQHLNRVIDNVRSWDPEALRPIPSDTPASK